MADAKWAAEERKLASAYDSRLLSGPQGDMYTVFTYLAQRLRLALTPDDLFLGRHKAAQNAMDKVLKKNPKSQPALTLRLRIQLAIHSPIEKIVEGFEKVRATGDFSSQTAWHVIYVLKHVHRLDLLVEMYRKLWEDHPDRLEYGTELLSAALSIWDLGNVVTSTRKLFNATRNPVWAQRAAWAEWVAHAPSPTTETPFHPPLADTKPLMTAKILLATSKSTSTSSDVMWLRLQILIASNALPQALEVATEDVKGASLARHWYRMGAVPVILEHIAERSEAAWEKEWDWAVQMIREDSEASRNYAFYRYLIRCAQKCANSKEKHEEAISALRDLHEKIGDKERSPLLAILELDNSCPRDLKEDEKIWRKDVEAYWARWGCKGPVVSELEGIAKGDERKMEWLMVMMEEKSKEEHSDLQAYREVVNASLLLLRQKPQDWKAEEDEIKRLWGLYKSGLAHGRNLPSTDIQHGDDVGLAAVQLILLQWSTDKTDEKPLLRAIACLRSIVSKSPSSSHAKCLLTRLARIAGASQMIPEDFFEEKGPSEVQLDTVAHLAIERSVGEVQLGTIHPGWQNVIDNAQRMYRKTLVDVPDWTKQGFFKGSYAKLSGMRALSHNVSHSLSSAALQVESIRHALMAGQEAPRDSVARLTAHLQQAQERSLVDNRDWEVVPDIGGNVVATKDLIGLGRDIGTKWVEQWGKLLLGLKGFGEELQLDWTEVMDDGLVDGEQRLSGGFARLGAWLEKAKAGDSSELGDVFNFEVQGIFASSSSRWEIFYNLVLFAEATKYLGIILTHLEEAATPQGTGKNRKKADPALVDIVVKVKTLRSKVSEQGAEAASKLEELEVADKAIDWDCVAGGLFDDVDFVKTVGQEVLAARAGGLKALRQLVASKK